MNDFMMNFRKSHEYDYLQWKAVTPAEIDDIICGATVAGTYPILENKEVVGMGTCYKHKSGAYFILEFSANDGLTCGEPSYRFDSAIANVSIDYDPETEKLPLHVLQQIYKTIDEWYRSIHA